MADSLMALLVISLAINLLIFCEKQLVRQQRIAEQKVAAARLGKEASDQYLLTRQKAIIHRNKMVAYASEDQVVVTDRGQLVLKVQ